MLEEIVLPPNWGVELDRCELGESELKLQVHLSNLQGWCPTCNQASGRVHSRYIRKPADLPIAGQAVLFRLTIRRFFCDNSDCQRRTFAEQVPLLVERKARRTVRQHQYLKAQAFALGGNPGSRLAHKMGLKVSRATLLRIIDKTPLPQRPTPRILGVDDWAKRKGVEYGSILVDLERHCPIDLLADRKAETFAKWLEAHPGVEIISRDRASAYADGARRGAPEAIQVADRWHLLKNLGDHLKVLFERKSACLLAPQANPVSQEVANLSETAQKEVAQSLHELEEAQPGLEQHSLPIAPPVQAEPDIPAQNDRLEEEVEEVGSPSRKSYLFQHIKALTKEGLSLRTIARELRVSRQTVRKYAQAEKVPTYSPRARQVSKLDLYKPYIALRWQQGVCKGIDLFLEIKERGYSGSWALVGQYLAKYRLENPPPKPTKIGRGRPPGWGKAAKQMTSGAAKIKPRPMLSAREAGWLMMKASDKLTEKEQQRLSYLRTFDEEVEAAYQLSQQFIKMVEERQGQKLEEWLAVVGQAVKQEQLVELGSFAKGIRQDFAAVKAGLTLEISNGQTEGQVNRLKTLKRAMYGKAKFALLRARVLHSDAA